MNLVLEKISLGLRHFSITQDVKHNRRVNKYFVRWNEILDTDCQDVTKRLQSFKLLCDLSVENY